MLSRYAFMIQYLAATWLFCGAFNSSFKDSVIIISSHQSIAKEQNIYMDILVNCIKNSSKSAGSHMLELQNI